MQKEQSVTQYFPQNLQAVFKNLSQENWNRMLEIRLRAGRPLAVTTADGIQYITAYGGFTQSSRLGAMISPKDVRETFRAICGWSLHSHEQEIAEGFITLPGGHRVGLCGTAVYRTREPAGNCRRDFFCSETENLRNGASELQTLKDISGLNIRLARACPGTADRLMKEIFNNGPASALLIGPPASGKTTVLRDLCRQLSERYRLSVVDQRGELGAVWQGVPQNDLGPNTDILDGVGKSEGISIALRTLSPQFIAVDEIGTAEDCAGLEMAAHCGVYLLATAHGEYSEREKWELAQKDPVFLMGSPVVRRLLKSDIFSYVVFLDLEQDAEKRFQNASGIVENRPSGQIRKILPVKKIKDVSAEWESCLV